MLLTSTHCHFGIRMVQWRPRWAARMMLNLLRDAAFGGLLRRPQREAEQRGGICAAHVAPQNLRKHELQRHIAVQSDVQSCVLITTI